MNSNGILHLSVNPDGKLSMWESTQEAMAKKGANEVVLQLSLTASQMQNVLRAEQLAREKKRGER